MTQFFLSDMTVIWTWPRYLQDKNSDKVSWKLKQNYGLKRVNMVLKQFDLLTQFLTQHDPYSMARLMKIEPKLWPLECSQGFSVIWPSDLVFDPGWSIFDFDQVLWSDLLTLFLTQHYPYSNLTEILSRWSIWPSLMKIRSKLWPLECSQGFSMIWPTDLVFDQTWSIFDLDPVWWRLAKKCGLWECSYSFSMIWPTDLLFWPRKIHIRTWPSLMKIGPNLWPL